MSATTFTQFAMAGQGAADALLAHVQREQPEAAEHIAELVATGAGLSVALTIRGGEAWVELLLRLPDATRSLACVPMTVGQTATAN